jgi:hypothetical protein
MRASRGAIPVLLGVATVVAAPTSALRQLRAFGLWASFADGSRGRALVRP